MTSLSAAQKPFSDSCEENKRPILEIIAPLFAAAHSVLEIGSGTGQHAVFFAAALPHLTWQTSELPEHHPGIQLWIKEAGLENLRPPIALDVKSGPWPAAGFDAVFSANTAHIMHWPAVQSMFRGVSAVLASGGLFALYGPFDYGGRHTSDSNARFDQWLKQRDPLSGIRDFTDLDALAHEHGLVLENDHPMPVNNRILVWRKSV